MGLFDLPSRVVRANLNDMVSKAEDSRKTGLEQAVSDMQEVLQYRYVRRSLRAIAEHCDKRNKKYSKDQSEANKMGTKSQISPF
jgi:phage shock protein A